MPLGGDLAEKAIYRTFIEARRLAEAMSAFAHVNGQDGGRYPLTGVGDVNTYALFAETIQQVTAERGRAGFIVPTGIATDDSTKAFFSSLPDKHRLASLYDFENREKLFEAVDSRMKFCLLTLGQAEAAEFAFFLLNTEHLEDKRRAFTLSAEDFELINPNTRTCPVFRSQADAELTKKIYRRVPVLMNESSEEPAMANPWGIRFSAMFHMSGDSGLFQDEPAEGLLPLYEAKMMHQFDHRWATYFWNKDKDTIDSKDVELAQKADPDYRVQPRYWVAEREVIARIARAPKCVIQAWLASEAEALLIAVAHWIESTYEDELLDGFNQQTARERVIEQGGPQFEALPPAEKDWFDRKLIADCLSWEPLSETELAQIRSAEYLEATISGILDHRSPRWLMGWRDITNATNERTVIASVVPRVGVGNNLPLMLFDESFSNSHYATLLGNLDSLIFDFIARHKVGGTHMNYFIYKQLPVLTPDAYSENDLAYIVPRVLELTYTSHDLSAWAEDLGYTGEPFVFDPQRRATLRAELDAYYAKLYGLTRDELRYILDPAATHGDDYPTETFRGLKNKELKAYSEYRTQRLVLEAWDALHTEQEVPVEIALPTFPRQPNDVDSLPLYTMNLCYAWIQLAGGHIPVVHLGRALSLLKNTQRLLSHLDGSLADLAVEWQQSYREPVANLSLRTTLEDLRSRGQLRLTQDDLGHYLLSLSDSAQPPTKLPEWVVLDARLSLESARVELASEPDIVPELDEVSTLLEEILNSTP